MDAMDVERALGDIPISIGTAMAVASMIETVGVKSQFKSTPLKSCKQIYVSVATLLRNVISSMPKAMQEMLSVDDLTQYVEDDIQIMSSMFKELKFPIFFYHLSHKSIATAYPVGNIRIPKTVKQVQTKDVQDAVIDKLHKNHKEVTSSSYKEFDLIIADSTIDIGTSDTIFLTSNPLDLLDLPQSKGCYYLQSYTGEWFAKSEWYKMFQINSKHRERPYHRIPFNRLFVQIFGDSKNFFQMPVKVLDPILDCADKYEWSQLTTHDRVKLTMQSSSIWESDYSKVKF